MKKFIFTTTALLAFGIASQAQNAKAESIMRHYRFGLYGNVGFSGLRPTSATVKTGSDDKTSYDVSRGAGRVSYGIGLTAEKPLTDNVTIYSGLGADWFGGQIKVKASYMDAGAAGTDSTKSDKFTYASGSEVMYKFQSVNVPLGLKLNASKLNDKMHIFGQVGADASLIIGRNANVTIDYNQFGPNASINGDTKLPIKTVIPFQLGWHFGVGVEYKITSKNSLYGTFLYRNNLFDITNPSARAAGVYAAPADINTFKWNDGNVRTNNYSLRVGYFF
jgi:hypothetical protein